MRIDTEMIGGAFILLLLGALVGGCLLMLTRFWGQCNTDTEFARERLVWPTTTVTATLVDAHVRSRRNHLWVIGEYQYEFGGKTNVAELHENSSGLREEREATARALKAEGKTVDLEVQYNPQDSTEVTHDIVTSVPNCRPWIAGFFVFFCLLELLILRGLYRTTLAIFR